VNLESDLTFRFGKRIGDERLQSFGAFFSTLQQKENKYFSGSIGRQLPAIFDFEAITNAPAAQPLLRDVWMPGIQVMTARSHAGTAKGLYIAAKGGHNAESHNHNDVGNFVIYKDGVPMIIDVGVETYTKKTFSPQRYEIWTMQSAYHNLPAIDGVMQRDGRDHAARDVSYSANEDFAEMKLDIAAAYPAEAGIDRWLRTVRLNRGKDIQVIDDFDLKKKAQKIQMTLMTSCGVKLSTPGRISLKNGSGLQTTQMQISFDSAKLKADVEKIEITDANLKSVWGEHINRITLTNKAPTEKNTWTLKFFP
jgi:hypothetical protein